MEMGMAIESDTGTCHMQRCRNKGSKLSKIPKSWDYITHTD
jgi:hypothetical protein